MKIHLENVRSRLEGTAQEVDWAYDYLSYPDHAARFRKLADPRVRLFRLVDRTFPSGLLPSMKVAARDEGLTLEVVDHRVRPIPKVTDVHPEAAKWLRDYQADAARTAIVKERGVLWLPTAAGKGNIAVAIVQSVPVKWLFVVHRKQLVDDIADRYHKLTGDTAGIIGDGCWEEGERLTCATLQTLAADLKRATPLLESVQGIVVDELHVLAAHTWIRVANSATNAHYRLGMSVGPDSMVMVSKCGNVMHERIEDLHTWYSSNTIEGLDVKVRAFDGDRFVWAPLVGTVAHDPASVPCYEITTSYGRKITVTEDHSVYRVEKGLRRGEVGTGRRRRAITTGSRAKYLPELRCVKGGDIKEGDFLFLENTLPCFDGDENAPADILPLLSSQGEYSLFSGGTVGTSCGRSSKAQRFINKTDLAYVVGFFVGDGWIDGSRVNFAVNREDLEGWLKQTKSLFDSIGAVPKVREMPRGSVEVRVGSVVLRDIIRAYGCDSPAHEKRLPPKLAWEGSDDVVRALLRGLHDSDGHTKCGSQGRVRVQYTTVSPLLAEDVTQVCKRLGIVASHYRKPPTLGGVVNGKQIVGRLETHVVHWSPLSSDGHRGSGRYPAVFAKGLDGLPVRVTSVRKVPSPRTVYDLQVGGAYNFVANGLLVHNSGTPLSRTDGKSIQIIGATGPVIYRVKAAELADKGWVSRPKVTAVQHRQISNKMTWQGVQKELIERSRLRNGLVCKIVKKAAKPCLVFVNGIQHGVALAKYFREDGLTAEFVSGSASIETRKQACQDLAHGNIDVLVATTIFNEGVDVPEIRSVVLASGGKSPIATLQRLGRGARIAEGKQGFELWDIADVGCGCTDPDFQGIPHNGCAWLSRHTKERIRAIEGEGYEVEVVKDLTS